MHPLRRSVPILLGILALAACDRGPVEAERPFLLGTPDNPEVAFVVNSTEQALTSILLGDPSEIRQVPFGAHQQSTPTGVAIRGTRAVVPLGNAASVAVVDLEGQRTERFFTFPGGNATGSAFADDTTVLVANLGDGYVGRFTLGQSGTGITETVDVAPRPTHIEMVGEHAFVISSNLDESWAPIGNGVVTAIDPRTLEVVGTVETGGTNPQSAALGPDGRLYVVNTGDWVSPGSITIIDPTTLAVVETVEGLPAGPGGISIDQDGVAYVSGFYFGTVAWDTRTGAFIRGPENPICAPLPTGGCRGASDAETDARGNLYQVFFGSPSEGLRPWVFVYRAGNFELSDSIAAGVGPTAIEIRSF